MEFSCMGRVGLGEGQRSSGQRAARRATTNGYDCPGRSMSGLPQFRQACKWSTLTLEVIGINLGQFAMQHDEWLVKENISQLRQLMSDQNLQLLPDYEQRISVLKDLGFITEDRRVALKGKVACEVHSAEELILTELVLENELAPLEPEEIVALLSAFVFQEKTDNVPILTARLEQGKEAIIRISEKVNQYQILHQVILSSEDSNDFVSRPRFGLVEVSTPKDRCPWSDAHSYYTGCL